MSKYKVGSPEFIEEAKRLGLTPWQYGQKLIKEGKLPNPVDIDRKERYGMIKKRGFDNFELYLDDLAKKRGFKDYVEYRKRERLPDPENNVCCVCGSNCSPYFRGCYDTKGNWDGTVMCDKCSRKMYNSLPDSYNNCVKYMRRSRLGNLDRFSNVGVAFIGQWIAAKTLGIKDSNIENNNFGEPIDLLGHTIYGNIDVKTCTFNNIHGYWQYGVKRHGSAVVTFDNIVVLCMDEYDIWKNVERVYIFPKFEVENIVNTAITKYSSMSGWYDKYKVDETRYNNMYHSVDIPRFFSPFDLWKGKYDKK